MTKKKKTQTAHFELRQELDSINPSPANDSEQIKQQWKVVKYS